MVPPSDSRKRRRPRQQAIVLSSDEEEETEEEEEEEKEKAEEDVKPIVKKQSVEKKKKKNTKKSNAKENISKRNKTEIEEIIIDPPSSDSDFESDTIEERKQQQQPVKQSNSKSLTWVDEYSQLKKQNGTCLISNRKLNDIKKWISSSTDSNSITKTTSKSKFLILSGPPGCGKSSAVKHLCHQQHLNIIKWEIPTVYNDSNNTQSISLQLIQHLKSFLLNAKYLPIDLNQPASVLFIDDLPICIDSSSYSSSTANKHLQNDLLEIFHHCIHFSNIPVILVLSDNNRNISLTLNFLLSNFKNNEHDLKSLITYISIPAVTDHAMKKHLNFIARAKRISLSNHVINEIIMIAAGDFRSALNCLQFSSLRKTNSNSNEQFVMNSNKKNIKNLKTLKLNQKAKKRLRTSSNNINNASKKAVKNAQSTLLSSNDIGNDDYDVDVANSKIKTKQFLEIDNIGSDGSIGMYHAISKILNNKRNADGSSKYDVNKIIQETECTDENIFIEFLHHNYLNFFGKSDDIIPVLNILSQCDQLSKWLQDDLQRTLMRNCCLSIVARAFLVFNRNAIRSGWRPIKGPENKSLVVQSKQQLALKRQAFLHHLCYPCDYAVVDSKIIHDVFSFVKHLQQHQQKQQHKFFNHNSHQCGIGNDNNNDLYLGGQKIVDQLDVALINAENNNNNSSQNLEDLNLNDFVNINLDQKSSQLKLEDDIEEWDDD